jgi:hypothetical protein
MPRWLVALSYFAALSILIVSDLSMWVTSAFPVWVLVVSALILARSGLFEHLRAGHIQATPSYFDRPPPGRELFPASMRFVTMPRLWDPAE